MARFIEARVPHRSSGQGRQADLSAAQSARRARAEFHVLFECFYSGHNGFYFPRAAAFPSSMSGRAARVLNQP